MVTNDARRDRSLEGWVRAQPQPKQREETGRHWCYMARAQPVLWAMPVAMRGGLQLLADLQLCPYPMEAAEPPAYHCCAS